MLEIRDELLTIDLADDELVEGVYGLAHRTTNHTKQLDDLPGLSLSQRLELTVLRSQLNFLCIHLSLVLTRDEEGESTLSIEEQVRRATIRCQAALISLGRLDHIFKGFRRTTFTQEMIARNTRDHDEAEKQLVDIRRSRDR